MHLVLHHLLKKKFKRDLERIRRDSINKPIIIFPPLIDWSIPLFQRPQHIALNLANEGYLYFYCVINQYDDVLGFKRINAGGDIYLTDQYELLVEEIENPIIHIYAQDPNIDSLFIQRNLNRGSTILYEYIDELTEDLCSAKEDVIDRHIEVLKNEKIFVVATANKLYNEISKYRNLNYRLVTNGVDYAHFANVNNISIPCDIERIINKNRPIIGYFGALAKWFDFGLIKKIASERPDNEILLIGWDYDGSLSKSEINKISNVTILGPISYKILPNYAKFFDVSVIPFLINDITEATSPVKLFEYMALGKPIVTTNLPECKKYDSVLIGKNHMEFIEKLDKALNLKDNIVYCDLLKKEALANTWQSKAKQIKNLIEG